jgi:hypothetical protein
MVNLTRSRWAAVGAAVAVSLGGGGLIGVSAADTSSTLVPIAPVRVLDTRASDIVGDIDDGAAITVQVTGSIVTVSEGSKVVVPAGASAIAGNLTLVSTTANDYGGFATIYPCGSRPEASNINFTSGQTVANSVAVPLSASGTVCIYVYGTAHVLLDVSGYFTTSEISDLSARVTEVEEAIVEPALASQIAAIVAPELDAVVAKTEELEDAVVSLETVTPLILIDSDGREFEAFGSGKDGWSQLPRSTTVGSYVTVLSDGEYWPISVDGPQALSSNFEYFTSPDCSGDIYYVADNWSSDGRTRGTSWMFGSYGYQPVVVEGRVFNSVAEGDVKRAVLDPDVSRPKSDVNAQLTPWGCAGATLTEEGVIRPVTYVELNLSISFPLVGVKD